MSRWISSWIAAAAACTSFFRRDEARWCVSLKDASNSATSCRDRRSRFSKHASSTTSLIVTSTRAGSSSLSKTPCRAATSAVMRLTSNFSIANSLLGQRRTSHDLCRSRSGGFPCSDQIQSVKLLEEVVFNDPQALFRHNRELTAAQCLVECDLGSNHLLDIPTKRFLISFNDRNGPQHLVLVFLVHGHIGESRSVLPYRSEILVYPYNHVPITACLGHLIEATERIGKPLAACDH